MEGSEEYTAEEANRFINSDPEIVALRRQRAAELSGKLEYFNQAAPFHEAYTASLATAIDQIGSTLRDAPFPWRENPELVDALAGVNSSFGSIFEFCQALQIHINGPQAQNSQKCDRWVIGTASEENWFAMASLPTEAADGHNGSVEDLQSIRTNLDDLLPSGKETWGGWCEDVQKKAYEAVEGLDASRKKIAELQLKIATTLGQDLNFISAIGDTFDQFFETASYASEMRDEVIKQLDIVIELETAFLDRMVRRIDYLYGDGLDFTTPSTPGEYADPQRGSKWANEFDIHPDIDSVFQTGEKVSTAVLKESAAFAADIEVYAGPPPEFDKFGEMIGEIPFGGIRSRLRWRFGGRTQNCKLGYVIDANEETVYLFHPNSAYYQYADGSLKYARPDGAAEYVKMLQDGELTHVHVIHHSSFTGGDSPMAAGEIVFDSNGIIEKIGDRSGHFMPAESATERAATWFRSKGLIRDITPIFLQTETSRVLGGEVLPGEPEKQILLEVDPNTKSRSLRRRAGEEIRKRKTVADGPMQTEWTLTISVKKRGDGEPLQFPKEYMDAIAEFALRNCGSDCLWDLSDLPREK